MSLVFSESTNNTGMYELFQGLTKTNPTSYPIAKYTRDANNALAQFKMLSDRASGKWQNDDTNQTDYPIVKIDLISGQQDYPFTVDGSTPPSGFVQAGNQILDIYRVECANSSGIYSELFPYDQSSDRSSFVENRKISGQPTRYDKLANGIFLDSKPNFNYRVANEGDAGLYIFVNRTPPYFTSAATTQKPGIPDFFHEYLVYRPAFLYCITNLPTLAPGYLNFLRTMEKDIELYFSGRDKDEHRNITNRSPRDFI